MATEIWVNIGSGNGLLPDGTKPLPEPMLTDHQWSPSGIHIRAISQEMPQPSISNLFENYIYLNFHSNLPGANELRLWGLCVLANGTVSSHAVSITPYLPAGFNQYFGEPLLLPKSDMFSNIHNFMTSWCFMWNISAIDTNSIEAEWRHLAT